MDKSVMSNNSDRKRPTEPRSPPSDTRCESCPAPTATLGRITAGGLQKAGGQTLGVLDQDVEKMLRCQALMAAPLGQCLRGLQKPARAFAVLLEVHDPILPSFDLGPGHRQPWSSMPFRCRTALQKVKRKSTPQT